MACPLDDSEHRCVRAERSGMAVLARPFAGMVAAHAARVSQLRQVAADEAGRHADREPGDRRRLRRRRGRADAQGAHARRALRRRRRRDQRGADDPRAGRRGRGLLPRRRHHRPGAGGADRAQRHRRRAGADRRPHPGQPHRLRDQHRPRVPLHARGPGGHRGRVAQLPRGALDRRRRLLRRQRQPRARHAAATSTPGSPAW